MTLLTAKPAKDTTFAYKRTRQGLTVLAASAGLALLGLFLGIVIGPVNVSAGEFFSIIIDNLGIGEMSDETARKARIVESIRVPRAVLAVLVGATLGASGAAMQGFFRNPLADPGLIGVSGGGALAAVGIIVLGGTFFSGLVLLLGRFTLPLAAFGGSLATVALIYRVSLVDGRVVVATMLLAGVAANALAASGIGYLTFLANDSQLRDLTFWTLGSLGGATWARVVPAAILMVIAITGLMTLARPMNSLLLGESDASTLGVDVEQVKRRAAVFTALGVGAATAVCGIINFIGLVVPHLVRLMTGPDHRFVLPGSALLGAALILFSDLIARMLVVPAELPLGVVTATIGAPFFFWLLLRDKRRVDMG
ncbi:MAG: iron ABC transporter permease [Pseudomonadota bacterium]